MTREYAEEVALRLGARSLGVVEGASAGDVLAFDSQGEITTAPNGGSSAATGMLEPVRAAATGNIASLSGLQTIDGVALNDGDRVLAWMQATAVAKGIYLARAGAWDRADDAPTLASMEGKLVFSAHEGAKQSNILFFVQDTNINPAVAGQYNAPNDYADLNGTWGQSMWVLFTYPVPGGANYYGWGIFGGYEVTATCPEPADGTIDPSSVANYYDDTNGAARFVRKGKTADGTVVQNISALSPNGAVFTRKHAAPADADLAAGDLGLWFDETNGAAKLMIKAKTADGTVVTGSVNLT